MNVFLLTDLEGIPGVLSIDAVAGGTAAYADACVRLTQFINSCARICRAAGADRVWFLDGHGGGNVRTDLLDGSAVQTDIVGWEALLRDGAIDCQIELGAHARAGTINGFLDHTISSSQWFALCVNGTEYSELAMHALMGRFGQAADLLGAVSYLLDDRASAFVTGITLPVDGGFLTQPGI